MVGEVEIGGTVVCLKAADILRQSSVIDPDETAIAQKRKELVSPKPVSRTGYVSISSSANAYKSRHEVRAAYPYG